MNRKRCSIVAVIAVLAVMVSPALASGHMRTQPTLTLKRDCQTYPGYEGLKITLSGFPPFTPFHGKEESPDGGSGEGDFQTDANGEFVSHGFGAQAVGIWTVTITWSGGTLTRSLYVDCSTRLFGLIAKLDERPQTSLRRVRIAATCDGSDCRAQINGAFRVRYPNQTKRLPLGSKTYTLQAGVRKTLVLRPPVSTQAAVRRALSKDRKVKLRTRVLARAIGSGIVRFRVFTSRVE